MSAGIVHKYGDNVDTDVIMPARYIVLTEPAELARHAMADIDAEFANRVRVGDIMVAGENFGCGSSREHAPIGLKASGIACVIAKSFARIFYRNAINIGLPIVECPEAAEQIKAGELVCVDFQNGLIYNETTGEKFQIEPFPAFIQKIIQANGLVNYTKQN